MSGISNTTLSGAVATPAPQKLPARDQVARPDAQPAAAPVVSTAVPTTKPAERAAADTTSRLRERLRAIAEGFGANTDLIIRVDNESKRYVYEFRDGKSGEIIHQYPEADLVSVLKENNFAQPGVFVSTAA